MRYALFILMCLLARPAVSPELSQDDINLEAIRLELKIAAESDPCRKVRTRKQLPEGNRACWEILQKFKQLPPKEQYTCQEPSEPAECVGHKEKWWTIYDCCFKAQFKPSQGNLITPRFTARMSDCMSAIKWDPFNPVPTVKKSKRAVKPQGNGNGNGNENENGNGNVNKGNEVRKRKVESVPTSVRILKTMTGKFDWNEYRSDSSARSKTIAKPKPGSEPESESSSESDSGSDNIYADPVFAEMRRNKKKTAEESDDIHSVPVFAETTRNKPTTKESGNVYLEPVSAEIHSKNPVKDGKNNNIYSDPVFAGMSRSAPTTRKESKCKDPLSLKILKILSCKCG